MIGIPYQKRRKNKNEKWKDGGLCFVFCVLFTNANNINEQSKMAKMGYKIQRATY